MDFVFLFVFVSGLTSKKNPESVDLPDETLTKMACSRDKTGYFGEMVATVIFGEDSNRQGQLLPAMKGVECGAQRRAKARRDLPQDTREV